MQTLKHDATTVSLKQQICWTLLELVDWESENIKNPIKKWLDSFEISSLPIHQKQKQQLNKVRRIDLEYTIL